MGLETNAAAVVFYLLFLAYGIKAQGGPCLTNNPCGLGTRCVQDTIFCVRAPCPQPAPRCVPFADACTFRREIGPCRAYFRRYFYNANAGRCELFGFGGCRGNGNNFRTLAQCQETCQGRSRVRVVDPLPPRNPVQRPRRPPGPAQACPNGLVFSNCGRTCTRTCANPSPRCVFRCEPGCMCPMDRPIYENGVCITRTQCPRLGGGLPTRNPNVRARCQYNSFTGRIDC